MPLSGKELVWLLLKNRWQLSRVNGSHHILKKDGITIPVPVHGSKALGKGIEQKILKQAGLKK